MLQVNHWMMSHDNMWRALDKGHPAVAMRRQESERKAHLAQHAMETDPDAPSHGSNSTNGATLHAMSSNSRSNVRVPLLFASVLLTLIGVWVCMLIALLACLRLLASEVNDQCLLVLLCTRAQAPMSWCRSRWLQSACC